MLTLESLDWGGAFFIRQHGLRLRSQSLSFVNMDACIEVQQICRDHFPELLESNTVVENLQSSNSFDPAHPSLKELAGLMLSLSLSLE